MTSNIGTSTERKSVPELSIVLALVALFGMGLAAGYYYSTNRKNET